MSILDPITLPDYTSALALRANRLLEFIYLLKYMCQNSPAVEVWRQVVKMGPSTMNPCKNAAGSGIGGARSQVEGGGDKQIPGQLHYGWIIEVEEEGYTSHPLVSTCI